jgi:hypothetical protein
MELDLGWLFGEQILAERKNLKLTLFLFVVM